MSEALSEFTGERLVPGEVDADLWNEHISRYAFAALFCGASSRVLDAGCGTGYGSNFLGRSAASVLGIDSSIDAIAYAAGHYRNANTRFAVGLCEALPTPRASADLIVAFEVIEHLIGWRAFLDECRAALSPHGVLLVSTPNKCQYNESRGAAGPNPFHIHEFDFAEFSAELERLFPHVLVFGQNHVGSIVFSAIGSAGVKAQLASLHAEPEQAGFFVAVCSSAPIASPFDFVYVPQSTNILRERERHIQLLRQELDRKNNELAGVHTAHSALVRTHRTLIAELERSNLWAESLSTALHDHGTRIVQLQAELESSRTWALSLNAEIHARDERVVDLQQQLADEQARAQAAVDRLEAELVSGTANARNAIASLESELDGRTEWARSLDVEIATARQIIDQRTKQLDAAQAELVRLRSSAWGKVGNALRFVRFPQ